MTRLARLLEDLRGRGQAECLHSEGQAQSCAELVAGIDRWRRELEAAGMGSGSVIALHPAYTLDSIAFLLAAWARCCVVALMPAEGDPDALLMDAHAMVQVDLDAPGASRWLPLPRPPDGHPLLDALRAADEAGVVIFTSGSSGRAKAVLHSVERFLLKYERRGRALRTLAFMQPDHVAGLDTLLYTLAAGGVLVVPVTRDPRDVCRAIESARAQVLSTSPSFLRLLWASGVASHHDLSSIEVVTYGSEPMDAATLERANRMFPSARISQKYGTTELGAPRTASQSSSSTWMRIGDERVEAQVREGILWIRSASQFLGYLNAQTPTDVDGWYCTGDLAVEEDGWIRVLGRESDIINVGGEKVSPTEVERVILELEEIAAVAVSGRAHPLLGQIVVAVVTPAPGVASDGVEKLVRRHCGSRLPRYMVPVMVDVSDKVPGSARQKIMRRSS